MLKLKYILNDLVDYAYGDDPKLPQYKCFYVEYLRKKLKTRNGDYRGDNHHLRIFTEGREDVQIIKTSIHELSHHVDFMQRGRCCHDAVFYEIYEKLLFAALDMGLFNMEAYKRCLKDSSDRSKVLKILERYHPRETGYKKGITRIRVIQAYEIRGQLKKRSYVFNAYDRTWEKEVEGEAAVSEEEQFLRSIGADFSLEDARVQTFNGQTGKRYVTGEGTEPQLKERYGGALEAGRQRTGPEAGQDTRSRGYGTRENDRLG